MCFSFELFDVPSSRSSLNSCFQMSGVFEDQGMEGLSEKIMEIVKEFKGDNSEVEVLKHIIIQTNLLLATSNVRLFCLVIVMA